MCSVFMFVQYIYFTCASIMTASRGGGIHVFKSHRPFPLSHYQLPQDYNCDKIVNPFLNDKFYILRNRKTLQTTILNLMTIEESSPKG